MERYIDMDVQSSRGVSRVSNLVFTSRGFTEGPSGAAKLREGEVFLLLLQRVSVHAERERGISVAQLICHPANALARGE
jgi:hypothetical protein